MKKIESLIENLINLSKEQGVAISIVVTDSEKNGQNVSQTGNAFELLKHLLAIETAMEQEMGVPIMIQKALAAISNGDPSKVCSCDKCTKKRMEAAMQNEHSGTLTEEDEIREMLANILKGKN